MKESNFQTEFKTKNTQFGVFELKLCKGTSIRFDAVKEHQIKALLEAQSPKGIYHKISDFPMFAGSKARFNFKKPFDCLNIHNQKAFVVIMFYTPRKKKNVYYILIDEWLKAEKLSVKKRITETEAEKIAFYTCSFLKK